MISSIKGILTELSPTSITIEANGIGYNLLIPLSTFDKLPKIDTECRILTHLHVREDILQLYGFSTHEERDLFKMLINISGIGPKMALTILSGMTVSDFKDAISMGNIDLLSEIPGIGKKTAQRLVVELRERVGKVIIKTSKPIVKENEALIQDAVNALLNLGYKQASARKALERVLSEEKDKIDLEDLLKKSLKYI